MPLTTDEVHKRTDNIYKAISDQYNPNLKTFLLAARAYEKALAAVSNASRHYYDSMNKLGIIASDSTSTKELGESMRQMSETLRQIQLHEDETTRFLRDEVLVPLENKLDHDQKYIYGAYRTYQMDFKLKMEDLERATAHHQKVKKKSVSGRKSYKYDDKQKELSSEVELKQKAIEQFQYDNLKQAFIEERRRYCFFVEQQSDYVKRCITYHQKSIESLNSQLSIWLESCADVKSLPQNASELLEQVTSSDNQSLYSIPEPPNTPAAQPFQMDGLNQTFNAMPYSMASIEGTDSTLHSESSGHNIIPRDSRKKVCAQYNHGVPGSPTQLSFEKGDVIILMIPQPRDGWHYGENDRTKMRGWFPYSYTKLMEPQERPQELIQGHMPLPPADYNNMDDSQNGIAPPDAGPQNPYKTMKDQFLHGNPFANVQLRKTDYE